MQLNPWMILFTAILLIGVSAHDDSDDDGLPDDVDIDDETFWQRWRGEIDIAAAAGDDDGDLDDGNDDDDDAERAMK